MPLLGSLGSTSSTLSSIHSSGNFGISQSSSRSAGSSSSASAPSSRTSCKCGSNNIEYEANLGHSVCVECGEVLEENAIVSEATFSETAKGGTVADGVRVNLDSSWASNRGGASGPVRMNSVESREVTIANGHRRIAQIGNQMRMSDRQIEAAQRYFNLAVIENFTKGRRANNVASACLYIVCRQEKLSHMLIDFSENLRINVYILGATFIRLVATLKLHDIPLVDPMLYIARFAAKLEFEDRYQEVVRDASRLVSRMDRDWITKGRRPSGICGACLYIAARMNGFKRSTWELVKVMKICETTLRNRLADFKNTPSSALSVEDFQTLMLEEAADPPSFVHKKKSKSIDSSTTLAITDGSPSLKRKRGVDELGFPIPGFVDDGYDEEYIEEDEGPRVAFANIMGFGDELEDIDDEEEFRAVLGSSALASIAEGEGIQMDADEEDLGDLDDDIEIMNVKLTDEEIEIKTQYWVDENADWIVKNAAKALAEKNGTGPKPKRPRKKRDGNSTASTTAQEAAQSLVSAKKQLSKKLNYDIVNSLFPDASSGSVVGIVAPEKAGTVASGSVTGFGSVGV
ncbi:transcription factor TFIIIB subunit brf1 [Dinochytrium kinnereticum]|nr:transcription factor TFIIIB subunit brf1 [Dinochytrium kinnereticum]